MSEITSIHQNIRQSKKFTKHWKQSLYLLSKISTEILPNNKGHLIRLNLANHLNPTHLHPTDSFTTLLNVRVEHDYQVRMNLTLSHTPFTRVQLPRLPFSFLRLFRTTATYNWRQSQRTEPLSSARGRKRKMGVQGLWELLAPVGRRVSVETLAGKKLAIGTSLSSPNPNPRNSFSISYFNSSLHLLPTATHLNP